MASPCGSGASSGYNLPTSNSVVMPRRAMARRDLVIRIRSEARAGLSRPVGDGEAEERAEMNKSYLTWGCTVISVSVAMLVATMLGKKSESVLWLVNICRGSFIILFVFGLWLVVLSFIPSRKRAPKMMVWLRNWPLWISIAAVVLAFALFVSILDH